MLHLKFRCQTRGQTHALAKCEASLLRGPRKTLPPKPKGIRLRTFTREPEETRDSLASEGALTAYWVLEGLASNEEKPHTIAEKVLCLCRHCRQTISALGVVLVQALHTSICFPLPLVDRP